MSLLLEAAAAWALWMGPMLLQATIVLALVAALDLLLRRIVWPQLLQALWILAILKLFLPPSLASPVSVATLLPEEVVATPSGTLGTGLLPWLFSAWLAAVLALVLVALLRARTFRRRLRAHAVPAPPAARRGLRRAVRRLGIRHTPALLISPLVRSPAVFGLVRPVVLLPVALPRSLGARELEHILLHEVAHVRRRDLWAQALFRAASILYWFHPLLWVARRRAHALREVCCDASVAARLRSEAPLYRATLLRAAASLLGTPGGAPAGFLGGPATILARLHWLDRGSWQRPLRRHAATAAAVVAMAVTVLPMARGARVLGEAGRELAQELRAAHEGVRRASRTGGCLHLRNAVFRLYAIERKAAGEER